MSFQTEKNNSDICAECGGKCCRYILLETTKDDHYKLEFWEAQGNIKFSETDTHVQYGQLSKCQHNTDDGKCAIYDKRPKLCREFPLPNLPRLWRNICPLWHERNGGKKTLRVFDTTER